ncbi:MAG: YceI family protein [Candidatus Obscuribacterales bacterium]|nr:YceI family protein [Candidatus Obscuribacterales bacterium]
MKGFLVAGLIVGVLVGSSKAANAKAANEWKIDPYHSKAGFAVKHMMISNVRGEFSKVSGTAEYDGKNIKTAKVNAIIEASSIDTGNDDRDKHLKNKDFFDVEKFPEIKFVSKKSTAAGAGKFKLTGDLTMHGVTKEVTLNVEGPSGQVNDKHGSIKVGAVATGKVNRKDFGLSYGGLMDNGGAMIGDEVAITLDIELAKSSEKKAEAK